MENKKVPGISTHYPPSPRRGEEGKFAIRPRDESGQLLSRCSSKFRKRKEGRKGKRVSPVKLNFTLLFLLLLSSSRRIIVRPFSKIVRGNVIRISSNRSCWDFNSRLLISDERLICRKYMENSRDVVIALRKNVVQASVFPTKLFSGLVINIPSSFKYNRITIKINGQRAKMV